jgi:hypothetical protein
MCRLASALIASVLAVRVLPVAGFVPRAAEIEAAHPITLSPLLRQTDVARNAVS